MTGPSRGWTRTRRRAVVPAADEPDDAARRRRRVELGRWLRTKREGLDPASFGLVLPVRRRTVGLTQVEVARLAGVDRRTYQQFEAGSVRPTAEVFGAIVAALGL